MPPRRSHLVYRLLSVASVPRLTRAARAGAQVFCFHNVVTSADSGVGDASLHLRVADFEELMNWLSASYEVLPVDELVAYASSRDGRRSLRGVAALTFDDAYEGFWRQGLPVLARLGLPATVFVVSSAAGDPETFWWDRLAASGALSEATRERELTEHRGLAREILETPGVTGGSAARGLPASLLPSPWDDIADFLRGQDLVTVGSHTVRHPNLTRMTDEELERELVDSREQIQAALGVCVDTISYPYGLHDARVRESARRAGYRAGFTLDSGSVRRGQDLMSLPRLNVPAGIGVEALECWAAGIRPSRRP